MTKEELKRLIVKKQSFLCIGLDTDMDRIPALIRNSYDDPIFEFNKRIIDATIDLAIAYKPNTSFYEAHGSKGWQSLEKTAGYLKSHQGGPVFTIADAKRGDIGNTSKQYAKAFFEHMGFDAITINPYMGHDSVMPFLQYQGKWTIVLGLTSNPGAMDFQVLQPQFPLLLEKLGIKTCYWKKLYELVIEESMKWGNPDNMMFVVGATHPDMLGAVRDCAPDHYFLVPGVGAQGGNLRDIAEKLMTKDSGVIVNSSRNIIYASDQSDFDQQAHIAAKKIQMEMAEILKEKIPPNQATN